MNIVVVSKEQDPDNRVDVEDQEDQKQDVDDAREAGAEAVEDDLKLGHGAHELEHAEQAQQAQQDDVARVAQRDPREEHDDEVQAVPTGEEVTPRLECLQAHPSTVLGIHDPLPMPGLLPSQLWLFILRVALDAPRRAQPQYALHRENSSDHFVQPIQDITIFPYHVLVRLYADQQTRHQNHNCGEHCEPDPLHDSKYSGGVGEVSREPCVLWRLHDSQHGRWGGQLILHTRQRRTIVVCHRYLQPFA
mmetsp:Transcript_8410/g.27481  ORF Transcript_8410/g.27481 Transcript_8410/m.27481 type:complete len:248 (+) Transcript_8410:1162-1905(+)